jgi:SAM-dependent methyltransferase
MAYADITRNDKNAIKRFLQRRRLCDALSLLRDRPRPQNIVDFGGGDGELCRRLAVRFPEAHIVCYEPSPSLREEAASVLQSSHTIVMASDLNQLPEGQSDLLFCMEVFEHLPPRQTAEALEAIHHVLADDGIAIIGVPLELFAPALLKGLFRMTRRYGAFDASARHVVGAALGILPRQRPVAEIVPGLPYYAYHLGFDHGRFREQLEEQFQVLQTAGSPVRWLRTWLNSEVYYVVQKVQPLRVTPAVLPEKRAARAA